MTKSGWLGPREAGHDQVWLAGPCVADQNKVWQARSVTSWLGYGLPKT